MSRIIVSVVFTRVFRPFFFFFFHSLSYVFFFRHFHDQLLSCFCCLKLCIWFFVSFAVSATCFCAATESSLCTTFLKSMVRSVQAGCTAIFYTCTGKTSLFSPKCQYFSVHCVFVMLDISVCFDCRTETDFSWLHMHSFCLFGFFSGDLIPIYLMFLFIYFLNL